LALACQFVPAGAVTLSDLMANQGQVLDASASNYAYPNSSLVSDGGTIYFISGRTKVAFASWNAFVGLGYSLKNVVKGSLANYTLSSYTIKTANTTHPWDSWLSYKKAIYYATQQGLIGVPSFSVFSSNGGDLSYVVPANKYDLAVLRASPNLPVLTAGDSRVNSNSASSYGFGGVSNVGVSNYSTSTILTAANPAYNPGYIVFGSTAQKIGSYILTGLQSQAVNLKSVTVNIQPNGTFNGAYNFVNFSAKASGVQFGTTAAAPAAAITFTAAAPVVVPAAGSVTVDIYADVLVWNSQQLTSLNPATTLAGCAGVGANNSASVNCGAVYGQNLSFVASTNAQTSPAVSSSINSAFAGGSIAPGSTAAKIGSYIITASASQGASLNSVSIGAQPGGGVSVLQNLFVKVNGSPFGAAQSAVASQGAYTFTATAPVAIAASQSATVDVYADIPAGSISYPGLNPATILMGCSGFGSLNNGALACNLVNGQNISLYANTAAPVSFPLTVALNSTFTGGTRIFGSQNQQIGSFTLTSTSTEPVNISTITIKVQPNTSQRWLQNIVVRTNNSYFAQPIASITPGASLTVNGNLSLPALGSATVDIYADVLSGGTAAVALSPASVLMGCIGYGVTDTAKVSCPALNGQDAALATSTPQ